MKHFRYIYINIYHIKCDKSVESLHQAGLLSALLKVILAFSYSETLQRKLLYPF